MSEKDMKREVTIANLNLNKFHLSFVQLFLLLLIFVSKKKKVPLKSLDIIAFGESSRVFVHLFFL